MLTRPQADSFVAHRKEKDAPGLQKEKERIAAAA
jgi:hypothetical protein